MATAQSMSGLRVMAVVKVTVATVMVIQTVFIRCLSAVRQRTAMYRGTQKHARRLSLAHTAAALELSGRL